MCVQKINRLLVVGLGLIGGSFALALKRAGHVEQVLGWDRSQEVMHRALALGIIDSVPASLAQAMQGCDVVMLAVPVAQTGPTLASLLPFVSDLTTLTDSGSTKQDVIEVARTVLGEKFRQFVPGHPIAGRESNGPDAAIAHLYDGKRVVLTPSAECELARLSQVRAAWQACGAQVCELSAFEHDQVFAAVSHLPHLLAFGLVDLFAQQAHAERLFQFAASGFRDFTRIAASSPEMWRDISLANQSALLHELDAYLSHVQNMRSMLAAGDGVALHNVFANAQAARQNWQKTIEAAEVAAKNQ